ncbi:hypothetical protein [Roseovarius pelagicus]|uniref:Uncharacterized protein n=1 Tax=Roseovarius pelagicus TaxID=2980108 RepID=A0ABY6D7Y8_9RHOB|nr:hypothetical protein [Roseovarius pelagicus]UXX82024.1 hypothetical protein N7U68_12975 [Roseovarius pelagicus]
MLIKRIQFDNLQFLPARGLHQAIVILTTDICTMSLLGTAEKPEQANRDSLSRALISDSLRQIRQMPEFRGGKRQIEMCKHMTQEFRNPIPTPTHQPEVRTLRA